MRRAPRQLRSSPSADEDPGGTSGTRLNSVWTLLYRVTSQDYVLVADFYIWFDPLEGTSDGDSAHVESRKGQFAAWFRSQLLVWCPLITRQNTGPVHPQSETNMRTSLWTSVWFWFCWAFAVSCLYFSGWQVGLTLNESFKPRSPADEIGKPVLLNDPLFSSQKLGIFLQMMPLNIWAPLHDILL